MSSINLKMFFFSSVQVPKKLVFFACVKRSGFTICTADDFFLLLENDVKKKLNNKVFLGKGKS